jgi:murein DD-endopeptidase MepM/ murein hydrolase activator NlpD
MFFCFNILVARTENGFEELSLEIKRKKGEIEELKKQQEIYEKNIEIKKGEIVSLNNQLDILENQLAENRVKIEMVKTEITKNQLEQKNIKLQIDQKEKKITEHKDQLAEFIRLIYREDQKSYLEVLLLNNSLAEFLDQIKYSESLQVSLQGTLDKIQLVRDSLLVQKKDLENKEKDLDKLKKELIDEEAQMKYEEEIKTSLLVQTQGAEKKFQGLLAELRQEQEQANADIITLEQEIRAKIAKSGKELGGNGVVDWPVAENKITAYFHDPDYPFRYIFEHPGIDIRAEQGSSVKAASGGYVARAKDAGMGYSYIMIIHDAGLSTVYGHLSKILVQEDTYVTRGQVIGLSGGLPGTPGAGRLSTGPHLHFEVRLNGIPVDPLGYLP